MSHQGSLKMRLSRTILLSFVFSCTLRQIYSQDAPVITPSFAVLFPDSEVIFTCNNASAVVVWSINGIITGSRNFPAGVSTVNDTTLRVNMSANATMYGCGIVISGGDIVQSNNATLVLADGVDMVNIMCSPMDEMNRCVVTWNASTINPNSVNVSVTYNVTIFGDDIDNRTLTVDVPMATIDLPAVDSDVNVFVTAMNVFGSADPSAVAVDEIMASSVINLVSMVPNVTMNTYSIVVMCKIDPEIIIQSCEVIATSDQRTVNGSAAVMNNMASVTVDNLMCEETYIITAGGVNNSTLVGPRFPQETPVAINPCPTPPIVNTTSSTDATTPISSIIPVTPTNTTGESGGNDDSDGSNVGAIVGVVCGIGVVAIVIIIIVVVYFCVYRNKNSKENNHNDHSGDETNIPLKSNHKYENIDKEPQQPLKSAPPKTDDTHKDTNVKTPGLSDDGDHGNDDENRKQNNTSTDDAQKDTNVKTPGLSDDDDHGNDDENQKQNKASLNYAVLQTLPAPTGIYIADAENTRTPYALVS